MTRLYLPLFIAASIFALRGDAQEAPSSESVKPGINESFLDPNLDVDNYIKRFEVESREVFAARLQILKATGIKSGMTIADIGSGTGLYTRLFARTVGQQGWVFAVDIVPKFLEHIRREMKTNQLTNVSPVLCSEDSVNLPKNSIDVAFICDTYHHFEYPNSTMHSLFQAIQPGGRLILIDFERIPGTTREWVLGHVRAGKSDFRAEIESVGFVFLKEVNIAGLKENYFLVFSKPKE